MDKNTFNHLIAKTRGMKPIRVKTTPKPFSEGKSEKLEEFNVENFTITSCNDIFVKMVDNRTKEEIKVKNLTDENYDNLNDAQINLRLQDLQIELANRTRRNAEKARIEFEKALANLERFKDNVQIEIIIEDESEDCPAFKEVMQLSRLSLATLPIR